MKCISGDVSFSPHAQSPSSSWAKRGCGCSPTATKPTASNAASCSLAETALLVLGAETAVRGFKAREKSLVMIDSLVVSVGNGEVSGNGRPRVRQSSVSAYVVRR